MRIALAFFGLPRCSPIAYPSIERCLIEPLAAAGELRVFHHLYRQDWVFNPRSGENHAQNDENYAPFAGFDGVVVPRPTEPSVLLQRLKTYGDAFQDGFHSLTNLMLQLHSLHEVTQRAATFEPDLVMFARPDLLYQEPLPPEHIAHVLAHPDEVLLPRWESWGGFNDRFALAGARAYRAYGGRLLLADHYCERTGRPLHSESFLRYALAFAAVPVRPIAMRATRVRVDGRLEWEDFEGARSPLATSYVD
jgi:hypothetical protein